MLLSVCLTVADLRPSIVYTSSRALYGLALNGNAPKIFTRVNRWGLPYVAVLTGVAFSLLSFMSASSGNAGEVFGWVSLSLAKQRNSD